MDLKQRHAGKAEEPAPWGNMYARTYMHTFITPLTDTKDIKQMIYKQ